MCDDEYDDGTPMHDEDAAKIFFETNTGVPINLKDVLLSLCDCEENLAAPPPDFSIKDFLQKTANDTNDDRCRIGKPNTPKRRRASSL